MSFTEDEIQQLVHEHRALLCLYAAAQLRCSEQLQDRAREVARLQAEQMRLRARLIMRESELAWEREDRLAFAATIPALPERAALARQVNTLLDCMDELMRDRGGVVPGAEGDAMVQSLRGEMNEQDMELLESSLRVADLVICQTGCVGQGSYWRVEDHCKRTGKPCVLVAQPDALRIVRVHSSGRAEQVVTAEAGDP